MTFSTVENNLNDQFFTTLEYGTLKIKSGYCDFSGKRNLSKKKANKKHHIYRHDTQKIFRDVRFEPLELINVIQDGRMQIIVYADSNQKVSFIRSKRHKNLSPQQIINKLEMTPMYRTTFLMLFSSVLILGVLRFRNYYFENISLSLGYRKTNNYKVHFLLPENIRKKFSSNTGKLSLLVHACWIRIPLKDIYHLYVNTSEINVPVYVRTLDQDESYYYNFKRSTSDGYNKNHFIFNTRSARLTGSDVEIYVRKSITGQYVFVVSSVMSRWTPFKEKIAYALSLFSRKKEKYDIYFEKFAKGAAESGFELFKHAVEKNKYSIYILDQNNPEYNILKRSYPKNLMAKNSIKAFYFIFLARSFISSDLVTHVQRRLYDNDSLIKRKILNNHFKVFLQHGVALATDLFERGYFNRKVPIAPDYIVVNSEYEHDLFESRSSYETEDLLITGLPNMDLYVDSHKQPKEEITFLLTWRPWDLTGNMDQGSYIGRYRQFFDLIRNDSFYDGKKVNVVLHPKAKVTLKEQFPDVYNANRSYLYEGDIKDILLKTKVLISDYSSVSYLAFAGGSNIVFYWEDKEECETQYGSPNILQEEIAFGDIVYDFNQLNDTIQSNFNRNQLKSHVDQYAQLVECTNGNNTLNTYEQVNRIISDYQY
ncbi:MAG TPA: CDP-glycerol glycerophosphotransferase family protein [Lentibacillus sp.]|uniref:CDP-glycerol glycerophosphotransferase family protein n=1 Tax=Lentibacillus sp. TaxID=1925746 RepID=UPI002B4AF81B|nr:CDP-glycerol glycerophosphotransferase family protein [Lentibacillus sp.]HLR62771.1 CDP-glycerol glycerophosphotransferase family protein [Lentibacillus sp.]